MYNFRTDLALERNDIYKKQNNLSSEIDGIEVNEESKENIKVSRVKITKEEGEKALGKPKGNYITVDIKKLKLLDDKKLEEISSVLADELRNVINEHIAETDDILVVGLGNIFVTPDALGPKVVPEIEVTRHILEYMPEIIPKDTRPVSAISPGVLGITRNRNNGNFKRNCGKHKA